MVEGSVPVSCSPRPTRVFYTWGGGVPASRRGEPGALPRQQRRLRRGSAEPGQRGGTLESSPAPGRRRDGAALSVTAAEGCGCWSCAWRSSAPPPAPVPREQPWGGRQRREVENRRRLPPG